MNQLWISGHKATSSCLMPEITIQSLQHSQICNVCGYVQGHECLAHCPNPCLVSQLPVLHLASYSGSVATAFASPDAGIHLSYPLYSISAHSQMPPSYFIWPNLMKLSSFMLEKTPFVLILLLNFLLMSCPKWMWRLDDQLSGDCWGKWGKGEEPDII